MALLQWNLGNKINDRSITLRLIASSLQVKCGNWLTELGIDAAHIDVQRQLDAEALDVLGGCFGN